jgi:hypothetical protein
MKMNSLSVKLSDIKEILKEWEEDESCNACADKSDCENCPFNPEIHEF